MATPCGNYVQHLDDSVLGMIKKRQHLSPVPLGRRVQKVMTCRHAHHGQTRAGCPPTAAQLRGAAARPSRASRPGARAGNPSPVPALRPSQPSPGGEPSSCPPPPDSPAASPAAQCWFSGTALMCGRRQRDCMVWQSPASLQSRLRGDAAFCTRVACSHAPVRVMKRQQCRSRTWSD